MCVLIHLCARTCTWVGVFILPEHVTVQFCMRLFDGTVGVEELFLNISTQSITSIVSLYGSIFVHLGACVCMYMYVCLRVCVCVSLVDNVCVYVILFARLCMFVLTTSSNSVGVNLSGWLRRIILLLFSLFANDANNLSFSSCCCLFGPFFLLKFRTWRCSQQRVTSNMALSLYAALVASTVFASSSRVCRISRERAS